MLTKDNQTNPTYEQRIRAIIADLEADENVQDIDRAACLFFLDAAALNAKPSPVRVLEFTPPHRAASA